MDLHTQLQYSSKQYHMFDNDISNRIDYDSNLISGGIDDGHNLIPHPTLQISHHLGYSFLFNGLNQIDSKFPSPNEASDQESPQSSPSFDPSNLFFNDSKSPVGPQSPSDSLSDGVHDDPSSLGVQEPQSSLVPDPKSLLVSSSVGVQDDLLQLLENPSSTLAELYSLLDQHSLLASSSMGIQADLFQLQVHPSQGVPSLFSAFPWKSVTLQYAAHTRKKGEKTQYFFKLCLDDVSNEKAKEMLDDLEKRLNSETLILKAKLRGKTDFKPTFKVECTKQERKGNDWEFLPPNVLRISFLAERLKGSKDKEICTYDLQICDQQSTIFEGTFECGRSEERKNSTSNRNSSEDKFRNHEETSSTTTTTTTTSTSMNTATNTTTNTATHTTKNNTGQSKKRKLQSDGNENNPHKKAKDSNHSPDVANSKPQNNNLEDRDDNSGKEQSFSN